jgi:hypothetical protein
MSESLAGAYACLRKPEMVPVDNIPKPLKRGFDFALWYAFSKACGDLSGNTFVNVPRVTSMLMTSSTAWTKSSQFTEIQKITAIVRVAAQRLSGNVGHPKRFLKGEGYFLEKFVGKKPVPGLYTDEELDLLTKHWLAKQEHVKAAYKGILDNFAQYVPQNKLGAILEGFSLKTPQDIKKIEDNVTRRIPSLLVRSGRRNQQAQSIAKGSNLSEKILTVGMAISNPRTVCKLIWSPIGILPSNDFADFTMTLAKRMFAKKEHLFDEYLKQVRDMNPDLAKAVSTDSSRLKNAASLVVEIYSDHRGDIPWDSALLS